MTPAFHLGVLAADFLKQANFGQVERPDEREQQKRAARDGSRGEQEAAERHHHEHAALDDDDERREARTRFPRDVAPHGVLLVHGGLEAAKRLRAHVQRLDDAHAAHVL
ncbi:MAG: hypothetical protein ACLSGS_12020, partial [Adlercreutzia sp.]